MDSKNAKRKTSHIRLASSTLVKVEEEDFTEITAITEIPQLGPAQEVKCLMAPQKSEEKSLVVLEQDLAS